MAELHFLALHSPYSETRRLYRRGHYSHSVVSRVLAGSIFDSVQRWRKNRSGSRSGRTLRGSSSSAGRPRHESSIAKNYLKSSSIEKNCLRSSSTWTSGVHRDKESLPNAKVQKPDWNTSARSSPEQAHRSSLLDAFHTTLRRPHLQDVAASLVASCCGSGILLCLSLQRPWLSVAAVTLFVVSSKSMSGFLVVQVMLLG